MCHRFFSACLLVLVVVSVSGCAQFNYKRFAYDILRQEDCRRNDVDSFCARSFVFEYDEYEQLRQEYMRDSTPHLWDLQQGTLQASSTRQAPEDL